MKIKTSELIGRPLDYAVAIALGGTDLQFDTVGTWWITINGKDHPLDSGWSAVPNFSPSTDWAQGGPIIEREFIELRNQTSFSGGWEAWKWLEETQDYLVIGKQGRYCPSPLVAAMRAYVAYKLGKEVEVPEELL